MADSPWRYPGGKRRLVPVIRDAISAVWQPDSLFGDAPPVIDVFTGGGGFLDLYPTGERLTLNDADTRVAAWWTVVAGDDEPFEALVSLLRDCRPTVALHAEQRCTEATDPVARAFQGIFMNRTSFSGILDGNPIGGANQESEWTVDCRWNTERLIAQHRAVRRRVRGARVLAGDFADALTGEGLALCDPPYVRQGPALYPVSMTYDDHARLAGCLRSRSAPWVLTYDDHPLVRDLYQFARIERIPARYSINGTKTSWAEAHELLIQPH